MEFQKHSSQRTNVQQIFQKIVDNGPISRRELQEITGFSWGLISKVTNHLIAEGYVVAEEDLDASGVGRRAEKLDVINSNHFFIGVDIDSDGMYAVVTDMKGRLVESAKYFWQEKVCGAVLQSLYGVLDRLMEKYREKSIKSIGVSVQGITDMARGVSAYISRIKDWVDVPLRELLNSRYGTDVVVAHDPDCVMEGERAFGLLKNTNLNDVLLLHYDHRLPAIGMSVMINGQIYIGHRGRAAEIGYAIIDEEDGKPRILEDILRTEVSAQKLCDSIGKAMAVANTMFNPEMIVLHILNSSNARQITDTVERWIHTASYDAAAIVKQSKLGQEAKALGAAMIMINRAIDKML